MQLKILWIGKTRNRLLSSLCEDYLERMQPMVSCEVIEIRDLSRARGLRGDRLKSAEGDEIGKHVREFGRLVVLDERGTEFSSRDFARWFQKEQRQGTRELNFVIGGAEGIGDGLASRADMRLSLGKMTWTHEMTRVLLLEQIYRAFSILQNSPYHK
jgi:23S rRNA (pseudouridine1915-N3)-methyltransferase